MSQRLLYRPAAMKRSRIAVALARNICSEKAISRMSKTFDDYFDFVIVGQLISVSAIEPMFVNPFRQSIEIMGVSQTSITREK